MHIFALGTYPIVRPMHGGQRRVAAFKRFYESCGLKYTYACIYEAGGYGAHEVSSDDRPLIISQAANGSVEGISDVNSGRQFETDQATLRHFASIIERDEPDTLELEQPFMWPMAKRLRQMYGERNLRVIYSSQNVEAPLKNDVLKSKAVKSSLRRSICAEIDQLEAELCSEAYLIICVCAADRQQYLQSHTSADVIVVPNGVDRPPSGSRYWANDVVQRTFAGRRFVMTVGSAHPPNADGICRYLTAGGAFFLPPTQSIAVCGKVSNLVWPSGEYQKYLAGNSARVQFFADIGDDALWAIKHSCHGVLLPLRTGGGSSLKAAEALALGKWTVATPVALRGFEAFFDAEGVLLVDDPTDFRRAVRKVLQSPALEISAAARTKRDVLYWDRCFADSGLSKNLLPNRSNSRSPDEPGISAQTQ